MKAFLLAGGLGTRLKPLTDNIPKCLVPICGKPLLDWWYLSFKKYNIDEVLINLHYLGDLVRDHIIDNYKDIKFHFYEEEILLGSAGTLRENNSFVKDEKDFFVLYADNLTNYNLLNFYNFHKQNKSNFTMALFRTDTPKSKGIALLDENNTVISFKEKPNHPKSNLANAGIYICTNEVLKVIPDNPIADIGFDLLPRLVNKMKGWETSDYLIDIGTHEHLKKAEIEWAKIIK